MSADRTNLLIVWTRLRRSMRPTESSEMGEGSALGAMLISRSTIVGFTEELSKEMLVKF